MKKKEILNHFIDHPALTSVLVVDLAILMFLRPPALVSLIMLGILIGVSMFFGEKLALFSNKTPDSQ
ncbi:MAG: hypothetical protein ABFS02_05965 [Pseudomonadota bacterium]